MGHPKAVAAFLCLVAAVGCASWQGFVTRTLRDPGMALETFPDLVWEEYDSEHQQRPFFVMEKSELVPKRLKPDTDFNHRMVYSMCPEQATQVVTGTLSTRSRFRGAAIVRDEVADYEIRPGRWIVDAFVTVPEHADPGVYAYEIEFQSADLRFDERMTFVVDEK